MIENIIREFINISPVLGISEDAFMQSLIRTNNLHLRYKFELGLRSLLSEIESYMVQESIRRTDLAEKSISNRIENLIKNILLKYAEFPNYRNFLKKRQIFGYKNPMFATKQLYKISDALWLAIGNSSTDFSFYTKRFTLSSLYGTILYKFINDYSYEFNNTFEFLHNRILNILAFTQLKGRIKEVFSL